MAEWRKLAKAAILTDNRIDTREVDLLRENLFADGKINQSELDFMQELRNDCKTSVKAFTELYIEAAKSHLLVEGVIGNAQAKWLRKTITDDEKVKPDEVEKRLLEELKAEAKKTSPEFDELYNECMSQ
ncbi:MAG: TerB family tellurite resistance protein [Candidatus Parabeggiatoa sp. nov. 2]|nr:MAG: hypothetical protein B6247_05605 [Beggiatoa sp. 4572_84]RKZ52820.1 MAG: TerB family tellurite resistance protein [Gammaproteobacteria bacterium]